MPEDLNRPNVSMPAFLTDNRIRLLIFGGKGGVGKTTAAAAAALYQARSDPQQNLLLASTDPAHSLRDSLADTALPPHLTVLEIDAGKFLADFKNRNQARLMEIAHRGTFLDQADINQFLALTLPGMDELMAFLQIGRWVQEGTYKRIILDTAPTGHTLRLLEMPAFIRLWLEALDALLGKHRYMKELFGGAYQRDDLDHFIEGLAAEVQELDALLMDSQRSCFVPVMLAEALSIEETSDLVTALQGMGIAVREGIVNRLYPAGGCPFCRHVHFQQQQALAQLLARPELAPLQLQGLPLYPHEVRGSVALESFWKGLMPVVPCEPAGPPPRVPPRVENPLPHPSSETALLVVAGKGGVGKTTLACAAALRLAHTRPDRRILLFSADPADSLADCLMRPVSARPQAVSANLWVMAVDAQAALTKLKDQYQEEISQFFSQILPNLDLTFDRQVMTRIMDLAPPGIDELMALVAVLDYLQPEQYDVLVLDAAPTGHLLRLLELPEIIQDWLKVFFGIFLKYKTVFRLPRMAQRLVKLSRDVKRLRALLADATQSRLYAVSILTQMALAETTDLLASCDHLNVRVAGLFLNLATPTKEDNLCCALAAREASLRKQFQTAFPAMPQAVVYWQSDPRGREQLEALGSLMMIGD